MFKPLIALWWRLIRFGFRLLYNELAFTYDFVSVVVSLGQWRCWGRAALQFIEAQPGEPVLELAHGTGNLHLDLHAAGYRAYGYDLSPYMGRIAQRKLRKAGYPARLIRGKAQRLPFPNSSFRAVVCTFPTDFILAPATLAEVHRVLQTDGRLIIVPNGMLTGTGVIAKGIEFLYRITGQREQKNEGSLGVVDYFAAYGYKADAYSVPCKRSIAQVIVARKEG